MGFHHAMGGICAGCAQVFPMCQPTLFFGCGEYVSKRPGDWLETPEFIQFATLEQLITLLTFCDRSERFHEGAWKDALERGVIQNILYRMAKLGEAL